MSRGPRPGPGPRGPGRFRLGRVDPYLVALVGILLLAVVVPLPEPARALTRTAANVVVTVVFLLYGMRLPTREVLAGLRNVRLQGGILAATYLLFPPLGLAAAALAGPALGETLALGVVYLSLLPSTVQSSVTFTSVAGGNVAGAITGATVSNVLGMFLTPALVLLTMGRAGAVGPAGLRAIVLQLLLPFVLGQLAQRWAGPWLRARRRLTLAVERGSVLLVVLAAGAAATAAGVWRSVTPMALGLLAVVGAVLLGTVLAATWWGGARLGLARPDRIALLMCGSKKSLATGLPMATVLFPAATTAAVAVPLILFHQLQLITCAAIARRLAR